MSAEIITKDDLQDFRLQIIGDIKVLLQAKPDGSKKWLKSAEVRRMLGISPNTLQNLRINGTLRYSRVGGMLYYKLEDINKVLERGQA
jgi:hypothetical protein